MTVSTTAIQGPPAQHLFQAIEVLDQGAVQRYVDNAGSPTVVSARKFNALAELIHLYMKVDAAAEEAFSSRRRAAMGFDDEEMDEDDDDQQANTAPVQNQIAMQVVAPKTDLERTREALRDRVVAIADVLIGAGGPNLDASMGSTKYAQSVGNFVKANCPDLYGPLFALHERGVLVKVAQEPTAVAHDVGRARRI